MKDRFIKGIAKRAFSLALALAMVLTLMPKYDHVAHAAVAKTTFDSNKTAEEMIGSLLGDGLTVTNIKTSGSVRRFNNGMDELGINGGISLDTSNYANGPVDPDLKALIQKGGFSYNNGSASTVSFELIATGSLLNFNYVFSSCEFDQNETFNDIFALFVSVNDGPFENIALLDNGKEVSIKSLKNGLPANTNNGSIYYAKRAVSFISNNTYGHGVTNVFNAQKAVQKGDKVVVKIAISDVGDDGYDSYVFIEAGSLSFDPPGAKPDYEVERLGELIPDANYVVTCDGETYEFTADDKGTFALAGADKNGKNYDFIGKTISIYQKGEGDIPDSDSVDVDIAERPIPQDPDIPTNTPSDIDINDVETTTNSIKVKAIAGQQYRLGADGPWVNPDAKGYVTFTGLTELTDYTIYTRVTATPKNLASETSDGVTVKTMGMFKPTKVEFTGQYDGKFHELKVNPNVEGATVTYSDSLNGTYSSETYSFKYSGEHKVYYCITKDNYYNAYGVLTANIAHGGSVYLAEVKAAAKEAIAAEVGDDTSDNVKAAAAAAIAAIDAATSDETVETEKDAGIAAIKAAKEENKEAAELEALRKAAIDAIEAEIGEDTSENVLAALEAAKNVIKNLVSTTEIDLEKAAAIAAIKAIQEENKETAELEAAKKAAIDAINAEVGTDTSENVKEAADAAKAVIATLISPEEIELEKTAAIAAIKVAKEENKEAADLETAKAAAIAAIDAEVGEDTSAGVLAMAEKFKGSVNAAATVTLVNMDRDAGIAAIKAVKAMQLQATVDAAVLAEAKTAAIAAIEAEAGENPAANVQSVVDQIKAAIEAATTVVAVEADRDAAIAAIKAVKEENAEAAALAAAKEAAIAAIDAAAGPDAPANVKDAADKAKAAINAAKTVEVVNLDKEAGIAAINEVKEENAENAALAAAKEAAIAAIDAAVGPDAPANVKAAAEKAKAAINAVISSTEVELEKAAGIAAINEVKEENAENAALDALKAAAKAAIDAEVGTDAPDHVKAAAEKAKAAIDAVISAAEVDLEKAAGIAAVNAAKEESVDVAVAAAKAAAIVAIDAALGTDASAEAKAAADAAKAAINAATDVAAVNAAKDAGVIAVKYAKNEGLYEGVKPETGKVENITGTDKAPKENNSLAATVSNDDFGRTLGVSAEEAEVGVTLWLSVTDVTQTITEADKTLIDAKKDNNTIGMYIDASMFMRVGDADAEKVHELNSKVKISFVVPANLRKAGRTYKIIRLHDGVADVIDADYNEATFTVSFETDRFSSYALAYADKPAPHTGVADYKGIFLGFSIVALGVMTVTIMHGKKKEEI